MVDFNLLRRKTPQQMAPFKMLQPMAVLSISLLLSSLISLIGITKKMKKGRKHASFFLSLIISKIPSSLIISQSVFVNKLIAERHAFKLSTLRFHKFFHLPPMR